MVTMIPDLYSYMEEHGELPDVITVRRFSGTDAQDLQPYLMDFCSYDVVSRYYSYALQYYKNSDNEIQWLPVCGLPQTIIANKTLFDQYGIKIPTNYQEYAEACQQFYENGIKPYSMDLAEDWSAHEVIQAGAIGEFTSLDGIEWRSSAETSSGEVKFDDGLWKRIFSEIRQVFKRLSFWERRYPCGCGYCIPELCRRKSSNVPRISGAYATAADTDGCGADLYSLFFPDLRGGLCVYDSVFKYCIQ